MARKRKKADVWDLDLTRLDECSLTELIQVARRAGYPHVSEQMPREDVEDLLLGDEVHQEDPLRQIRQYLHEYLTGNSVMLSGLDCSTQCKVCPHGRVVDCYARNHDLVTPPEDNPLL
jgi:hypothetical protein